MWHESGILKREIEIYRELHEKFNIFTNIISFGDKNDIDICKNYPFIKVYYNKLKLHPRLYQFLIPILFFKLFIKIKLVKKQINFMVYI